ncbi:hypothetical protein F4813DRAFT_202444 [Daldinia decipiens]|uniref:uncharacterized protein n=1 Tax=Daldinia decipiens TaxID=326647 RepID=UPI0020C4A556|nr:uncharacterized protein F4813DRAFT_202444 [Daldinia decipiens]KAI1654739.1 hypothetical protein F4813DRAFT_202444 [Daldinia decipiens]
MSQSQNGRYNGQPPAMEGSVKRAREMARARELADANGARGKISPFPEPASMRRPQVPAGLQLRDEQGQIGMAISRPTPLSQWPLAGPVAAPSPSDSEPYRPPPGRSQPPQRPPRPSRVPSILDSSRIQEYTPTFQYAPQNAGASELSAPETMQSESLRLSTNSSVGTIPDFPLPVAADSLTPTRRSVNLGPPPSSRRGASSFYSTVSYVSPIPEESLRTRSRTSYASSAAIPDSFENLSPGYSPGAVSINDTIAEESFISDDADETSLVRSASIGKRGKPALITTGSFEKSDSMLRPGPTPVQGGPFRDGTGYIEASSSSSGNVSREAVGTGVTTDNMLNAFEGASATDPSSIRNVGPSPRPYNSLSAIRRPPRLDIDAVRAAEARGSLTSLPDLIRRATRLASLMDRGRRPGSRFNDLDFPEEAYGNDPEKDFYYNNNNKHQSGLSDMLAAFPPPATRSGVRKSRLSAAWPLGRMSFRGPPAATEPGVDPERGPQKKGRRCCGLPIWTLFALAFMLLCIVTAAVIVPVKFLVLDKPVEKSVAQPAISNCEAQLTCANGGTNVVVQGVCSCICSNGFTGADCTVPTSQGCTTTSIIMEGTNINNVTIGQAVPRLIRDAQSNFSIPLVATLIQSKFNKESLSCNTENALVTFNGQSFRTQESSAEVSDLSSSPHLAQAAIAAEDIAITLSVFPDIDITLTVENPAGTGAFTGSFVVTTLTNPTTISGSTLFATTITPSNSKRSSPTPQPTTASTTASTTTPTTTPTTAPASTTTTTTSSSTSSAPVPSSTFTVTEEIVDFARVAVLYIFQEQALSDAVTAQSSVQSFFTDVDAGRNTSSRVMMDQGLNVTLGGGNTIDFVNLFVDIGRGRVGGRNN